MAKNLVSTLSIGIASIQKELANSTRRMISVNVKPPQPHRLPETTAPRVVILERLAKLPQKPQSALIDRWLPYTQQKRKIIYQPPPPDPFCRVSRNAIIQWQTPKIVIKRRIKNLGVIHAEPSEYVSKYGNSLKTFYQLPQFARDTFLIPNTIYHPFTTLETSMTSLMKQAIRISSATPISTVSSPMSKLIIKENN
jgi:hypothetical protein